MVLSVFSKLSVLVFSLILLFSCGGLEPDEPTGKSYLAGTLTYFGGKDAWPKPPDSVYAMRIIAFQDPIYLSPIDEEGLVSLIEQGRVLFTLESLPLNVDSSYFAIEVENSPIEYKYIVAAWQYNSNIISQRVAGIYSESSNNSVPSGLILQKGDSTDIRISIDWDNLPPQPF